MTDENVVENNEVEVDAEAELEALKARADLLGVKYHPKTKAEKLRAKIELHLAAQDDEQEEEVEAPAAEMTRAQVRAQRRKDASKLIRVRVTCMNPNKKNWRGEIVSVGSAKMGTFKKFIPFDSPDGWHIPKIIYDALKERKFSSFTSVKTAKGQTVRKARLVPEFSIEVLPDLTEKELKEIARKQALASGEAEE